MLSTIDIKDNYWVEFVEQSPGAALFHHPFWSICLAQSYGYRPFVLVMKAENGQILAGLPVMEINSWLTGKRSVALPFSDHCGPLLNNPNDLELFCRELIHKNTEFNPPGIEIRQRLPLLDGIVQENSYFIHYLKLDDRPEELFNRFRKNHIRCIRKACKLGVVVTQNVQIKSLVTFYNLHLLTRKKQGVPTQPKKYFIKLWEHIISQGMGLVMLAYYGGKPIAGGVFLHYNGNLIYKYGASDPDYLKLCGNHAIFWEAIQWGYRNGYKVMDWGKTDKSNQGLRNFKLGWGTEEKELIYSYIGTSPKEYSIGWKKKAVEKVIQKSSVWVGRIIGEMLYKHVG